MRKLSLVPVITVGFFPLALYAAPCESNFASQGNFFSEKTYKTFAILANKTNENAYEGALSIIAKEPSWQILKQEKSQGLILATQAESYKNGKSIPLNINIESLDSGSKISITYVTPAGTMSPESAIRDEFCRIIESAENTTSTKTTTLSQNTKSPQTNTNNDASNTAYVKNGMPCVAEICLGDGIAELRKVKWDKVNKAPPAYVKLDFAELEKNFRGNLTSSAPYLISTELSGSRVYFDNQALPNLEKVVANCGFKTPSFSGTFTTQSGNPTTVGIALIPSSDNSEQKWMVVGISRHFPNAISSQQHQEINDQLNARYGAFNYSRVPQEFGQPQFVGNGGLGLSLYLLYPDITERLRLHPLCGGSSKVKVD